MNTTQDKLSSERSPGRLARVGVECPCCHYRQFIEIGLDQWPLEAPAAAEIHKHLAEWMASHCPEHLTLSLGQMKN